MKKNIVILSFLAGMVFFCFGDSTENSVNSWIEPYNNQLQVLAFDDDGDGVDDYRMRVDADGQKIVEELDFNHDGKWDDFYFYKHGVMSMREIDTNFDGKIDAWVYLTEGVFIQRFDRDTDFDGVIDISRNYEQ